MPKLIGAPKGSSHQMVHRVHIQYGRASIIEISRVSQLNVLDMFQHDLKKSKHSGTYGYCDGAKLEKAGTIQKITLDSFV